MRRLSQVAGPSGPQGPGGHRLVPHSRGRNSRPPSGRLPSLPDAPLSAAGVDVPSGRTLRKAQLDPNRLAAFVFDRQREMWMLRRKRDVELSPAEPLPSSTPVVRGVASKSTELGDP